MTEYEETISNPFLQFEIEYCAHILRKKQQIQPEFIKCLEETEQPTDFREAYNKATAEEWVCKSLCSSYVSPHTEFELMTPVSWKNDISGLQSSKEYPIDRASPIISKLSQIWVDSTIGLKRISDINRIHRNLVFDITSSDLIDDFFKIEFPTEDMEVVSEFLSGLSPEIIQFCFKLQIQRYLPAAISLIYRNFKIISKLDVQQEQDPETGEELLVFNVEIPGEIDEILDNYNRYTDHFVSSIPWPDRHKIRLSFNII